MKYPEIYVLRHGETEWNAAGILQGALNSPLTAKGIAQAKAQGRILGAQDLSHCTGLSSPQGRAMQTTGYALAPYIGRVETDDRLREIGVGEWAGVQRETLGVEFDWAEVPGETLNLYEQAPGGEGFEALEIRCRSMLEALTRPSVLVTHGITGRMLRALWLGGGPDSMNDLPGGQGVVFHLKDGNHTVLQDPC